LGGGYSIDLKCSWGGENSGLPYLESCTCKMHVTGHVNVCLCEHACNMHVTCLHATW